MSEWRNWQTRTVQSRMDYIREGSSPSSGILKIMPETKTQQEQTENNQINQETLEALQKVRFRKVIKGLIIVAVVVFFFLHSYLPTSLNHYLVQFTSFETELFDSDVIIVFGAGTNKTGQPLQKERVKAAVELYNEGRVNKIIMTGGESKYGFIEAAAMKDYAVSLGAPAGDILVEPLAKNTYENAENSYQIVQDNNFQRIILVTSCYHTRRAFRSFQFFQRENLMITSPADCWALEPGIANRWLGLKDILREIIANMYYDYRYMKTNEF